MGTAPIAFQCADFLVKFPAGGLLGKARKAVFGPASVAELNQRALGALEYVYSRTPYCLAVVLDSEYDTRGVRKIIDPICADAVWVCRKRVELAHRMINGGFLLYVDDDAGRLREARRGAVTLEELGRILKGGRANDRH
jgi:hypothetical protein